MDVQPTANQVSATITMEGMPDRRIRAPASLCVRMIERRLSHPPASHVDTLTLPAGSFHHQNPR
jgi:hypothetical protein